MSLNKKEISKNFLYAFVAQTSALILSVIMTFIVPRLLGVEAFSYWQLFIFYTQYGGYLLFGLNDGIYLRIGGKKYQGLDYTKLGTQYKISMIWQLAICIAIFFIASFYVSTDRLWIVSLSCICTLLGNTIFFYGYILQAVNKTKIYSIALILERSIFILILITLLLLKEDNYQYIIILYIISRILSMAYCIWNCREIFFAKFRPLNSVFKDLKENIKVGIILSASSISSMLILGIGRFLIDANFGLTEFSKISFAIMMTNFFLVFMNQISLVLFPSLRRLENTEIPFYYREMSLFVSMFTPMILLTYPLINIFIRHWLPDYIDSVHYLIWLLPLVCFDGKMQVVSNTFFKVSRKERILLTLNIKSCLLSLFLTLTTVYIFHDINWVVAAMLFVLVFRSIYADILLNRLYGLKVGIINIKLLLVVFIFISAYNLMSLFSATLLVLICYIVYIIHDNTFRNKLQIKIFHKK